MNGTPLSALVSDERGSLALEQILFIGAIIALSAGLFVFYDNLAGYFSNVGFASPPTGIGGASPTGSN